MEPRSRETARETSRPRGEPVVSLVDWLESDRASCARRYDRLYVPRNDGRYLQRNAIVALGNSGTPEHLACSRDSTTSTRSGQSAIEERAG